MESTGTRENIQYLDNQSILCILALHINCSQSARDILVKLGGFEIEERGEVEMKVRKKIRIYNKTICTKGKGKQMTYYVKGENIDVRRDRISKEKLKYPSLRYTLGAEEKRTIL